MVAQFDQDRLFAIKTENASAATRASELKARLMGLMQDKPDMRAAHLHINADANKSTAKALDKFTAKIEAMAKRHKELSTDIELN